MKINIFLFYVSFFLFSCTNDSVKKISEDVYLINDWIYDLKKSSEKIDFYTVGKFSNTKVINYEDDKSEYSLIIKFKFLKKDKNTSSEVTNKNTEHDEEVSNDEVIDVEGQEDSLLVPLDAWNTVLNQLGNLHEASQQMAEARERAAKAEAEAEFLREKLKNTREQLDQVKNKKRFFFF